MRPLFFLSLICALMSLLALLGMSVVTMAPGSEAERFHTPIMLTQVVFLAAWLGQAGWARSRLRSDPQSWPPRWLSRLWMLAGILYLLVGLLVLLG